MRGIVLFAHGARDPEWAGPFVAIRDAVRRQRPENPIVLAFLESMQPTLEEAVAELVDEGASSVMVFPLFMAQGGHLKGDVPQLLERLRAAYPNVPIAIEAALGDVPEITNAIASWVVNRSE